MFLNIRNFFTGALKELKIGGVKIILSLFILFTSLLLYLLPVYENPPISPGSKWCYHYRETLIYDGKPIYEKKETLKYLSLNLTGNILVVRIERTFEWRFFYENRTEVIASNASDEALSSVNIKNRMYIDGSYTSWWIPTRIFIGSSVPIWNIDFNVKGLSWIVINGKILECWVLEYRSALEEYTILYERVTGTFIKYEIKTFIGSSQQLLRERWLIDSDVTWPALTIVRPFLLLAAITFLLILIILFIKKIRRHLGKVSKKRGLDQNHLLV